jgi:hypothetical protein
MKMPNSNYINNKRKAQSKAESVFEEYKSLLSDKTHPDNQTEAYKKNVIDILNRLLVCADEMDSQNPGQGIFSLIVLSLRSNIKLKDKITELEFENKKIKREIANLKKQTK